MHRETDVRQALEDAARAAPDDAGLLTAVAKRHRRHRSRVTGAKGMAALAACGTAAAVAVAALHGPPSPRPAATPAPQPAQMTFVAFPFTPTTPGRYWTQIEPDAGFAALHLWPDDPDLPQLEIDVTATAPTADHPAGVSRTSAATVRDHPATYVVLAGPGGRDAVPYAFLTWQEGPHEFVTVYAIGFGMADTAMFGIGNGLVDTPLPASSEVALSVLPARTRLASVNRTTLVIIMDTDGPGGPEGTIQVTDQGPEAAPGQGRYGRTDDPRAGTASYLFRAANNDLVDITVTGGLHGLVDPEGLAGTLRVTDGWSR